MSYFNGQRIEDEFPERPSQKEQPKPEPTFSLNDMIECWKAAEFYGETKRDDTLLTHILCPDQKRYFRQKFNITLNQQQNG